MGTAATILVLLTGAGATAASANLPSGTAAAQPQFHAVLQANVTVMDLGDSWAGQQRHIANSNARRTSRFEGFHHDG